MMKHVLINASLLTSQKFMLSPGRCPRLALADDRFREEGIELRLWTDAFGV